MKAKAKNETYPVWCNYCKVLISEEDDYISVKQKFYHVSCWKQQNFIDEPFEDTEIFIGE